jgi:PadR family transcriptional regulator PadR
MDAQLKRGLLDVCVLKALSKEDSYGYAIVRSLTGRIDISESTLYPILRRLEAGGAVTEYSRETGGRLRKYYAITGDGRERIARFLDEWREVNAIYEYIRGEGLGDDEA